MLLLTLVAWCGIPGSAAFAGPPDISQPSPDRKWLFRAHWIGNHGYTWELQNTTTHKAFFTQPAPSATDDTLPQRLDPLWSPDCHYLAINVYYGRIAYEVDLIALVGDVPDRNVTWPHIEETSMIKTEDRQLWNHIGIANTATNEWSKPDVLVVGVDLRSELIDKATGTRFRIDSTRQVSIQFSGLKGKIVDSQPPEYDKQPE